MASKILSIDLQSDLLTAVLLEDDINKDIIASTAIITADKTPEEIITELTDSLDCSDCRCFLSLGASFFTFQNLHLPFSERKAILKVLPFELEDNSASPVDTMIIDILINEHGDNESEIIVAMLEKETIREYHSTLKQQGLTPEVITLSGIASINEIQTSGQAPDEFIFLDLRLNTAALFFISENKLQLIRNLTFSPLPFGAEITAALEFEEDGSLYIHGPEHSAESFHELALSVKQTLAPLLLSQDFEKIPIYIDGTTGSTKHAGSWLAAPDAFNRNCLICGLPGGPLPQPIQMPEASECHASYLAPSLSLGKHGDTLKNGLNFCKEEFRFRGDLKEYRNIGTIAGISLLTLLVLFIGYLIWDTSSLRKERAVLVTEIYTVFKETLPKVTRIVDPVQQLNVAIKNADIASSDGSGQMLSHTALHILREISLLIPASIDVRLTRLVYESKGIRLTGLTDSFKSVNTIQKKLEESAIFSTVTISSTKQTPKDNKIRFDLKIDPEVKAP
jgi:Tfp pilus assembly protein PilN